MSCTTKQTEINYHWQCRRGMLELDILLNNFVSRKIDTLDESQKKILQRLLSYPDQTLHDLLLGNSVSSDTEINHLIQQIQSTSID